MKLDINSKELRVFVKVINIQLNLFTSAVLGTKNVAVVERKPMSKGSETRVRV